MRKWMDFIDYGPQYNPVVRKIDVKQYGIAKVVIVRTIKNGGIRRVSIPARSN